MAQDRLAALRAEYRCERRAQGSRKPRTPVMPGVLGLPSCRSWFASHLVTGERSKCNFDAIRTTYTHAVSAHAILWIFRVLHCGCLFLSGPLCLLAGTHSTHLVRSSHG
jgi:hypothetical protein